MKLNEISAAKFRKERQAEHAEFLKQQEVAEANAKRENREARARYEQQLEAERAEARKRHDTEIDREIEPQKQILMRQWLADHPGKTETDFNKDAWQHLRANLVEQRQQEMLESARQSMLQDGRYSL